MTANRLKKNTVSALALLAMLLTHPAIRAQDNPNDSTLKEATLDNVIRYALEHQPLVQQSLIDETITDKVIKGKLADWFPQLNFQYNYQRNIDIQTLYFAGNFVKSGAKNVSFGQITASETLFNRDVLLAGTTASRVRLQAKQNTGRNKMDAIVNTTKAFYDVLATMQQIKIGEEDIIRLERSLKDAHSRYTSGLTDKTDYKRATIQLSNSKATLLSNREQLKYKTEFLKAVIGYPMNENLPIKYDTLQMENEVAMDTAQQINYTEHIDYKILYTQRELQRANVNYSKWAFIPSLSAFGTYGLNYYNNQFGELYNSKYPYSNVGLTLAVPIFQGGKRTYKVQEQNWALKRVDWELANLRNNLNSNYSRALAAYRSNLAFYLSLKESVTIAQEVYEVIQLQYKNGVRAYLDVTIAETDLRTTRINYYNALYQVLASKMDVQRALGQINY
jgi:outer membrane protein TolC